MRVIALAVMIVLTGAPSTFAMGVQCEPESSVLLKITFVGHGGDEFGAIDAVDLRAVCRDRQMFHVETYARPNYPFSGGVVKGKVREEHFRNLLTAMEAIRIGLMTSCAVDEPFESTFTAQITWLGRNSRRNTFTIVRGENEEYRVCNSAETAFAVTAFSLYFDSADVTTFTTFP